MKLHLSPRSVIGAVALALSVSVPAVAEEGSHDVEGRFSVVSEAGGAIWAFQPGGLLVLTGPGEIMSQGTWSPGSLDLDRDFDAAIDYDVAGQQLTVLGQVSPDGQAIAVYVQASDPARPDDADPWPAESRLVGERFGMVALASPEPGLIVCERPDWVDGEVDWDRCGGPEPDPS